MNTEPEISGEAATEDPVVETAPAVQAAAEAPAAPTGIRLGFVRGAAPSRWAKRWKEITGERLELVPVNAVFGHRIASEANYDVLLERTRPGEMPADRGANNEERRSLRLYTEAVGLVVAADHELAEATSVTLEDIALVKLLDHPDHVADWPAPERWEDPAWMPKKAAVALDIVATGAGAILLPLPYARHAVSKKEHRVIPVAESAGLNGGHIWATWGADRDNAEVQALVGVLRGRTVRSSRPGADADAPVEAPKKKVQQQPKKQQPKLKPGSRGAQLQASRERAERNRAMKAAAKRRKRR